MGVVSTRLKELLEISMLSFEIASSVLMWIQVDPISGYISELPSHVCC